MSLKPGTSCGHQAGSHRSKARSYANRLLWTLLSTLAFCLVLTIGAAWHCVEVRKSAESKAMILVPSPTKIPTTTYFVVVALNGDYDDVLPCAGWYGDYADAQAILEMHLLKKHMVIKKVTISYQNLALINEMFSKTEDVTEEDKTK